MTAAIPVPRNLSQAPFQPAPWDRDNVRFREGIFSAHRAFAPVLKAGWSAELERIDYRAANLRILHASERLKRGDLRLSMDDAELRDWCDRKANYCRQVCQGRAEAEAVFKLSGELEQYGMEAPRVDLFGVAGVLARLCEPAWWRRRVRALQARECDEIARDMRMVHQRKQCYVSDFALHARRRQGARNRALLQEMTAVNQDGDEYTLAELADLSVSNPAVRRSELMVRIAGFEEVAKRRGMVAEFYTMTCPSRFHAMHTTGGRNAKFDGSTVRAAQGHLRGVWCRARAALARAGIRVFGFRVAEPHHDGCPHWHFLLFVDPAAADSCAAILRKYALQVDGDEVGAAKHRFKRERIDPSRGSAVGYIAKYISKSIDGYGLEADLFGNDEVAGAERVVSWAGTHGVRQFQQIGGPSVTVWRELRRLGEGECPESVEPFRAAADAADWAAFVELMGGPFCGRSQALQVAWWQEFDPETGEMLDAVQGRYGDFLRGKIIGLWDAGQVVCTRFYRWVIARCTAPASARKQLAPVPASGRGVFFAQGQSWPPWSSVNNCTGVSAA